MRQPQPSALSTDLLANKMTGRSSGGVDGTMTHSKELGVDGNHHDDYELTDGHEHELERDIAVVEYFKRPWWKWALFWILGPLSAFSVWLACLWSLSFRTALMFAPASIQDAEFVFIELRDKRSDISKIYTLPPSANQARPIRYFIFHTVRFIYSAQRRAFEAVPNVAPVFSHEMSAARRAVGAGLQPCSQPQRARQRRELQYGDNLLLVSTPSFWLIFAHDALQPFCCFQYLSVIIWSCEGYYTYSVIILVITMASVITNSVSQYQERASMAELAHYVCDVERVLHEGEAQQQQGGGKERGVGPNGHPLVPSSSLVPGDVVVVGPGKVAYDGVLLEGETVMDETVLTGESVPVRKAAYDPDLDGAAYNTDTFNHCTLFNGTIVSAVRGGRGGRPALAIVVSTGFNTAKGRLLRTIMFPRPHDLQFIKQAVYFIIMMFVMAMGFYIWDVVAMTRLGVPAGTIVLKAFDMITTAVPPALACCLAIATTISVMRLKSHNIHVLDNERVALAGLLDNICFDKTGTLTEAGLELGGVVAVEGGRFLSQESDPDAMGQAIQQLFAACHGLTQLGSAVVGDPLDQRLFEASGYDMKFEEDPPAALTAPTTATTTGSPDGAGMGQQAAGAAGPFLVLQRRQRAMPVSFAPAGLSEEPRHMAAHWGLLLPGGPRSDQVPAAPASPQGPDSGGGAGPDGGRRSYEREGMLKTLSRQLSYPLRRLSHDPGQHGGTSQGGGDGGEARPPQGDPHHAPIMLAGGQFDPEETIHVLRRFDFSSERLRSTAVLRQPDGRLMVVTKGSPEKLLTLMDPASVPDDFADTLQVYTNQGLRVIAMAWREVTGLSHPSQVLSLTQDQLEANTQLLGFVLMVNKLKPESAPAILHLHRACIRTAMVTGDHVRTAVTVARQCAIMHDKTPALVMDVDRGPLQESDFTFELLMTAPPSDTHKQPDQPTAARTFAAPPSFAQPSIASLATTPSGHTASNGTLGATTHDTPPSTTTPQEGSSSTTAATATITPQPALNGAHNGTPTSSGSPFAPGAANGKGGAGGGGGPRVVEHAVAVRSAAGGEVQVAVTGRAWQKANLDPEKHAELLDIMLQRGTVFARMNPEDKRSLIQQLGFGEVDATGRMRRGCGYYTGYCGDGANDLGALKGALVGVSLCDAEASIAAPMTSRTPHVGVMVTVVAEGRCSLVTSLIIFKYTMVYAYIQVLALALLYNMGFTVGNYQYLIQDLFHTTLLASCMGLTGPAESLSRERPLARVLSAGVILPVVAQMAVDTIFQLVSLALLFRQSWYTPYEGTDYISIPVSEARVENGVLMIICSWQLVINAMVFNVGRPFRKGLWTNYWLLASLVALIGFNLYVLWAPADEFITHVPAVTAMPTSFRAVLFGLVVLNLVCAYLADWLSKKLYWAGKACIEKRSALSKQDRRLRGGVLGLAPQATPSLELQNAMSRATQGLLTAGGARSTLDVSSSRPTA